jgi:RNA polymerase sigma-70 factor, ECF subfamily
MPAISEHEPSEQQRLVRAAGNGDSEAWEDLYRSIYPRLRAFFIRRLGADHADDGVSETMTRAVASIHRFKWSESGFDAWVFGIARHVSADHYRTRDRAQRYQHIGGQFSSAPPDGAEPVDQALVRTDDQDMVHQAFGQLSPAEREVLELRVIAGLSAEQVGKVLKKRPGAVRTAQARALAHLRENMAGHDA